MYGDFTAMVDHMVGRVLTALEQSGMREETLVIFSSDNGPVWYDKDTEKFGHDAMGGMRGMKGDAYEGGHRMPFIVRWPGNVNAGSASAQTICFTDVLATMAEVVGHKLGVGEGPDSFSFLPALRGQSREHTDARGPLLLVSAKGHHSLRIGKWKYIDGVGSGGFSDGQGASYQAKRAGADALQVQLYDMENDSGETMNLAAKEPALVQKMASELKRLQGESHTRAY